MLGEQGEITAIFGRAHLSPTQVKKLQKAYNLIELQSQEIYFLKGDINDSDLTILHDLLQSTSRLDEDGFKSYYVVPRLGTISSWSSKAYNIIKNVSLQSVQGIELCVQFRIKAETKSDLSFLFDKMTQSLLFEFPTSNMLFDHGVTDRIEEYSYLNVEDTKRTIHKLNIEHNIGLNKHQLDYLIEYYNREKQRISLAELMMFSQVQSEHCRHHIFNSQWILNGKPKEQTLFQLIRSTHAANPNSTLSAYSDNGAVIKGFHVMDLQAIGEDNHYEKVEMDKDLVLKVETHNHPTAICPHPGAATGVGGELRDEAAVGIGSRYKMGMSGYMTSNLNIPGYIQLWERPNSDLERPSHLASSLKIMLDAPIGASQYSNEFGRPTTCGFFRTLEVYPRIHSVDWLGYYKPSMIAGGIGSINRIHINKREVQDDDLVLVLGGPSFLVGLGGGNSSSMQNTNTRITTDYSSVQRANAEMQRRAQCVIDKLTSLGEDNPIISIHDVGAGGLSNAIPELVNDHSKGVYIDLRQIHTNEPGMSAMMNWCNESQERFVLAIRPQSLDLINQVCIRERCPVSVAGYVLLKPLLKVWDTNTQKFCIDMPMNALFHKFDTQIRTDRSTPNYKMTLANLNFNIQDQLYKVLSHPSVASKSFLITIGDRSVGGLIGRDQLIGKYQIPISDVAVSTSTFGDVRGEAMAVGERPLIAVVDPKSSAEICFLEAVTNILAADVQLTHIRLSANWMADCAKLGQSNALYEACLSLSEFTIKCGVSIPVGKDSLSMNVNWDSQSCSSPVSLVVTAFAKVQDVRLTLTPELQGLDLDTQLMFIDLNLGHYPLSCSAYSLVNDEVGSDSDFPINRCTPDLLIAFVQSINALRRKKSNSGKYDSCILAYHDRSDGGLITALLEMAFSVRKGLDILMNSTSIINELFSEGPGVVIQIESNDYQLVQDTFNSFGFSVDHIHNVARINEDQKLRIYNRDDLIYEKEILELNLIWSEMSYQIQSIRDNPTYSEQERSLIIDPNHKGLIYDLKFEFNPVIPTLLKGYKKPLVAILREQGVNGHTEMANAFLEAGFQPIDVTMSDWILDPQLILQFSGMVAAGGFSYGDVLGAGQGWLANIKYNLKLKEVFTSFINDRSKFILGVCNGCQFLTSLLHHVDPDSSYSERMEKNLSDQFEARLVNVQIPHSTNSIFLKGMQGSILPIVVSHGEGRFKFPNDEMKGIEIALQYVNSDGSPTMIYPLNPNGSQSSAAAISSREGRILLLMPHPERTLYKWNFSYMPTEIKNKLNDKAYWFQIFQNAYNWIQNQ